MVALLPSGLELKNTVTNRSAPSTLDAALNRLAETFRGMTARADETNCECHWGSAEELASLKVPDVELDPDLLGRTWQAPDWDDHASVMRRVLPQLATALVTGGVEDYFLVDVGDSLARARWQQWPAEQVDAVRDFLHAWWAHCLTGSDPPAPVHEAFALCTEASGTVGPWLTSWEGTLHPLADQRLAEALAQWDFYLLEETLPWSTMDNEEQKRRDLTVWLLRHAPSRLGSHNDSDHLRNVLRLMAIPGLTRFDDPRWPFPAYKSTTSQLSSAGYGVVKHRDRRPLTVRSTSDRSCWTAGQTTPRESTGQKCEPPTFCFSSRQ